jgi:hypothetical protein
VRNNSLLNVSNKTQGSGDLLWTVPAEKEDLNWMVEILLCQWLYIQDPRAVLPGPNQTLSTEYPEYPPKQRKREEDANQTVKTNGSKGSRQQI